MTVFTSKMITWREKNERNTIFVDGGENKEKKAQLDISEKLNIAECKICILVKQLHFFCWWDLSSITKSGASCQNPKTELSSQFSLTLTNTEYWDEQAFLKIPNVSHICETFGIFRHIYIYVLNRVGLKKLEVHPKHPNVPCYCSSYLWSKAKCDWRRKTFKCNFLKQTEAHIFSSHNIFILLCIFRIWLIWGKWELRWECLTYM